MIKESIKGRKLNQKFITPAIFNTTTQHKRVSWKDNNFQASKRNNHFSINNQHEKHKISVSKVKKLKDSKTSYIVNDRNSLKKTLPTQNMYNLQQNKTTSYSMLTSLNTSTTQPRLMFAHRANNPHQSYQSYNLNPQNQSARHLTYGLNSFESKSVYDSRNYQNRNHYKAHSFLTPKYSKQQSKLIDQKNIHVSNKTIKQQYIKQQHQINLQQHHQQLKTQSSMSQIEIKPMLNQIISKAEQPKMCFRKAESINSSSFSDDENSIVLQHFSIQNMNSSKRYGDESELNMYQKLSFNKRKSEKYNNY